MDQFSFKSIGIIHSCFKEKFGIPRQPGLVGEAKATLELLPPYDRPEAVTGLEGFSHIWLTFIFHGIEAGKWKPTVRPPRMGGNQRIGVFASRSTHRPNPIGLSVVELEGIDISSGRVHLNLKGVDLLDGTPVLDIKPYLPYADALSEANAGYANEVPEAKLVVKFSNRAESELKKYEAVSPELRKLVRRLLALDPRPAYAREHDLNRIYGFRLCDFDVKWQMIKQGCIEVITIEAVT